MKTLLFSTLLLSLNACTWVELNEQGKAVRLTQYEHIQACQKIGNVTAKTRAEILGAQRSAEKIHIELTRLAKNEAAKLGANTIVAKHAELNGEQAFDAYQCSQ